MKQKEQLEKLKSLSILYIEDENLIREEMSKTLNLLCKDVTSYSNAEDALISYNQKKPDLILSDISLVKQSGIDLTKQIRETDKTTPIILLSAHTDTEYLLEAAKLKLVAYLTKPINFEDLKNTLIEASEEINSHEEETTNNLFCLNDSIYFDIEHKTLKVEDKYKKLSSYESRFIEYFIKNKARTISADEIKNHVWDDPYDATDTALKSLIYKVRTKIGKETIKNLSGIGYFLNYKK